MHTWLHILTSPKGILGSPEEIKISQWLHIISVAKQHQSDLGRLRKYFKATAAVGSFQWTWLPGIDPLPSCQRILNRRHLSLTLDSIGDICESLDLLHVSPYCLNSDKRWVGWKWGNVRKMVEDKKTLFWQMCVWLRINSHSPSGTRSRL